jgi:hypothetical protein
MRCRSWIAEFTRYETPDGKIFEFEADDKFIVSDEGYGLPPIEYKTQRGPRQHGNTMVDYRLEKRVIQIITRQDTCSRFDYWDARADWINMLRPNRHAYNKKTPGILQKYLPNGEKRFIKAVIEEGPIFGPQDQEVWDEWGFTEALRFVCNDPIFYDPTPICYTWTLATSDHLVFPFFFRVPTSEREDGGGLLFAQSVINSPEEVTYDATFESYPEFEIIGPLNGTEIYHAELDKTIKLNYNIIAGDTVTIGLQPGNKVVTSTLNGDIIGTVSNPRDLTTFRLLPDPELSNGINTIIVTGTDAVADSSFANSQVQMTFYRRFIGI